MSSAFNLSTLVAMQDQRVEQTSVYFWRCQLTDANPRFVWNPEAPGEKPDTTAAATSKEADDKKAAADADVGESTESDDENGDDDDEEDDAISTRHLLHVSGCVLGPKATGLHLVTVRTGTSYQKRQATGKMQAEPATADAAAAAAAASVAEPEACPIVCMDPAAQRTLALSHEFVLEKHQLQLQPAHLAAGTCVFELAEGSGPVWLTGTHRIHRVVPVSGAAEESEDEGDDEELEGEDEVGDEEEEEAEAEAGESDDDEEEEEEEIEEEADDDQDMIEEVKPLAASKKTKQQKKSGAANASTKAPLARKKPQSTAAAAAAAAANGKLARKRVRPDS